jgi:glycosyltransferase involved in cell wall biosynthesis
MTEGMTPCATPESERAHPSVAIAVLAHNEARRIGKCLDTLTADAPGIPIDVVVNGSSDETAAIARAHPNRCISVREYAQGGKSRSWNRFVLDETTRYAACQIFVDGDAEVTPGSILGLAAILAENPGANLASGMPRNGRKVEHYRSKMRAEHGVFGDLYAARGSFLERMKSAGIRLPDDLIGDDGLIGALAKTDLQNEDHWDNNRVVVCEAAGFLCEPVQLARSHTLKMQYRRMINYSMRHFQNRIISQIMRTKGPHAFPGNLADLYPQWLEKFSPRRDPRSWWFDRQALKRMRKLSK